MLLRAPSGKKADERILTKWLQPLAIAVARVPDHVVLKCKSPIERSSSPLRRLLHLR
jgi:hypothetical protein